MSANPEALFERETLPDLPDLDALKAAAYQRRDHFARRLAEDQAEMEKAEANIAALEGQAITKTARRTTIGVAPETYRRVLDVLATYGYALGLHELADEANVSRGHVGVVMREAVKRGHAVQTDPQAVRRVRWKLTPDGKEFLRQANVSANGHSPSERLVLANGHASS